MSIYCGIVFHVAVGIHKKILQYFIIDIKSDDNHGNFL